MAPVMAALHARMFAPLHAQVWSASDFATIVDVPGTVALIAAQDRHDKTGPAGEQNAPCGLVVGRAAPQQSEILTLGVLPDHRRAGIGRALVESLADRFAGQGGRLWLEVAADDKTAVRFYRRLGFADAGRRPAYYRRAARGTVPVDALIMARELPGPRA